MVFAERRASVRGLVALLVVALVALAACDSDDGSDAAGNGDSVGSDDGTATSTPDEAKDAENDDDEADSDDDDQESEDETTVEGATSKQQKRIDKGKPTLLIRAPEDGAQVKSPLTMRFEVLNGEIVKNSADEDGYLIFVKIGKSSSMVPIYDDQGEIRFRQNGSTKVTAMLGGRQGPIKKTAVTITVTVSGADTGEFSSGD
jgi:hypothetical protein